MFTKGLCSQLRSQPAPLVRWYDQVLDHFNPGAHPTFKERYLIYDKVWAVLLDSQRRTVSTSNSILRCSSFPPRLQAAQFYNGSGPIFFCPGGEADVMAG